MLGSTAPGRPSSRALVSSLAAALLLAGCSASGADTGRSASSGEGSPAAESSGPVVLQPGEPGQPARTVDPSSVPSAPEWNHTDLAFVQMMVLHHGQALEMSRLAMQQARDSQVRALARRIEGAQGPEIIELAAWLQQRGVEVPRATDDLEAFDHGAHGHQSMAGMLTEAQMNELAAARGREFDRLFLRRMISHHRGAIEMAGSVATEGSDVRVGEIATDITVSQTDEIATMEELLRRL